MSMRLRPDWLGAVSRKIEAKIEADRIARDGRRWTFEEMESAARRWRGLTGDRVVTRAIERALQRSAK